MTTNGLTTAQQQAVFSQINLANATGTLTTSQMTSALITETRNEADAKALLLNAGLISSETAEANATNTVTAAKLRELVATGKLTQAEAQLLATKAGVTLANQKQASSFTLLGGKLKNVGNSLMALGKAHPLLSLLTAGATLFGIAITIAEKKNEEFIESQENLIEKIDENISKYDDEISSLDALQEKLQDAKGDKEALASIQSELNSAIGDTPGLLNEESNAYDIANQKIDDRIKRLETLRKLELEDKITAQKEIFNNSLVDNDWGIDHKFDYFSNHKIIASDTLGSEFRGYLDGINVNSFETLQSIFEALKKNGYGNGKKSNAEIWKELIDSYGGAMLDTKEIQNYFDNQTEYAQKILSDYINNSESIFSQEELNSIIGNLVESGYSQDLEGIKNIIASLVENDELEKTINDYYESLYEDDVDSDSLYQKIKSQFDTLVTNYPELKGILDNYFNNIGKDIKTSVNDSQPDEDEILSFSEAWESLLNIDDSKSELKNTRKELEELAKSGQLTKETFEKVEGTSSFLKMIGTDAEEAVKQIMELMSAQEKLSSASQGLDKLKSAYEEFKDKDIGFVTAETLESLPDAFKELEGFDLFSKIVGDPTQGTDKIQQAFNDIVREYILCQSTLNGLIDADESTIQSYIANLQQMGITNAEEVVKASVANANMMKKAEKEYIASLNSEGVATVNFAKETETINNKLMNLLGDSYKTDYDNWVNLLKEKAKAWNAYASALAVSLNKINAAAAPYSTDYMYQQSQNQNTDIGLDKYGSYGANVKELTKNKIAEAKQKYDSISKQAEQANQKLIGDLTMSTDFGFQYNPSNSSGSDGSGGSGGSGSDSGSNTKEEIDWIEICLESLQKKAEEVIDTIDKKVTLKQANKAIKESIKHTNTYLDNLKNAKEKYLGYFNEIDLPGYKELIKNGKMDIQTITDENLKTQIQKAQELWDKYQGCVDSIKEQKQQLKELNQMKLDKITEFYDKQQDLYDSSISTEESKIKYKEDAGIVVKESDYNTAINDAKKNENSRLKELNKFKKKLDKQKKKGLRGSELKERQAELKQKYQDYYDSRSKRIELEQQQSDIALTKLQNERELLESNMNKWQSVIDLKDAQGKEITKRDYQKMITNAEKQNKSYEDQNKILQNQQKNVKKYSARWYELQGEINSNNDAIQKNIISMEEYSDSIDNIKLNKLERQLELLNSIHGIYSDILSFREAQGQDKNYSEYLEQIANNREEIKTLDAEIAEKDRLIASENKENTVKIEELRKERAELESQRWNLKADNETLWKEAITSPLTDALDKISDELSDMNEKLNEQRDLEEAQYNLQKAQNQKNQLVLTKDGFKYQSDLDAVKEAQQKLDDIKYQKAIDKLEEIKEVIEKIAKESTIYDKNGNWIGYDDATLKKINSLILPVLNSNMYSDEQKNGLKNIVQELLNPKSDPVNSAINEKYTENTSKKDGLVLKKVQTPLLTSMGNMANLISGNMLNIINTYSVAEKILNSIHPKKINTATTFTGDIVIKESVDNVETFADAILKNLPNAVNRKLNKN